MKLGKFVETLSDKQLSEEQSSTFLDTTNNETTIVYGIKRVSIEKALQQKYKKEIDKSTVDAIYKISSTFLKTHPDIEVKNNDINSVVKLIELSLQYSNKSLADEKRTFKELVDTTIKQHMYRKDVTEKMLNSNVKPIGLNMARITNMKFVIDPGRTAIEFNENLDKNIIKMIESIDDDYFGLKILNVTKDIVDDNMNRLNVYKIKIKPKKGRVYTTTLNIPALVNEGTYLKLSGQLYVINNQLMQKTLIKKTADSVQLKTNYSVITYRLKNSLLTTKTYNDIVEVFLNNLKTAKKLKKAVIMDKNTETRLSAYGINNDIIKDLNYKNIQITV